MLKPSKEKKRGDMEMKRITGVIMLIMLIMVCVLFAGCSKTGNCENCGMNGKLHSLAVGGRTYQLCDSCYSWIKALSNAGNFAANAGFSAGTGNNSNPPAKKTNLQLPSESDCINALKNHYENYKLDNIAISNISLSSDSSASFQAGFTIGYPTYDVEILSEGTIYWSDFDNQWETQGTYAGTFEEKSMVYDLAKLNGTWYGTLNHAFNETVLTANNLPCEISISNAGKMEYAYNTFRDDTVRVNSNIEALCSKNAGNAFQYYTFSQGDVRISGDNSFMFGGFEDAKFIITIPSSFSMYDSPSKWDAQIVVYSDRVIFDNHNQCFADTYLTK